MKPKNMKEKIRVLKGEGEFDYDFKHDILFFKVKDREYAKSIELDNITIDIDKEKFVVGIQIFEASKFFRVSKDIILKIQKWEFEANIHENRLEFRLTFLMKFRNKIIERNPIIMQSLMEPLPNSEVICEIA